MQQTIVYVILAVAVGYALVRIVRTLQGRGDCGCGRGHDCPHNRGERTDSGCKGCTHSHNQSLSVATMLTLSALTATANVGSMPRAEAAIVGIDAAAAAQLITDLAGQPDTELHHLIMAKDGIVIAEFHSTPFRATDGHNQFSASKMLTALAVGLAVDDGLLALDDKVVDHLQDKLPATVTPALQAITIKHLLTMTSGKRVATDIRSFSNNWAKRWLALPGIEPGQKFAYDTMTPFMLSAIVQRATGRTMLSYLYDRILQPMGITDVEWEMSPDSINTGGWGVRCSTESMAMLGQLLLRRGVWHGQQLISADWIDRMTSDQLTPMGVDPGHGDNYKWGYGYLMWRCPWSTGYRAEGNLGQFVIVDTALKLVLAFNAAAPDQSRLLPVIRQSLQRLATQTVNPASQEQLDSLCQQMSLPLVSGQQWSGSHDYLRLELKDNYFDIKSIALSRQNGHALATLRHPDNTTDTLPLGYNQWLYAPLQGKPYYYIDARNRYSGMTQGFAAAGNYAWASSSRLLAQIYYVDWYSGILLDIDLAQQQLTATANQSPQWHEPIDFGISYISTATYDVNQDGNVDIADLNEVINTMLGKTHHHCDVNDDGTVDIVDINQMINALLGWTD